MSGQETCQVCQRSMENRRALDTHMEKWHKRRSIWSCSTLNNLKPSDFFETFYDDDGLTEESFCLCCGASLFRDPEEPDLRAQHLEEEHGFGKHLCDQTCTIREQFYSHLASRHRVGVDYMRDVMKCCQQRRAPGAMEER
jgi:hypothetical protein